MALKSRILNMYRVVSFFLLLFLSRESYSNPIFLTDNSHEALLTFQKYLDYGTSDIILAAVCALVLELAFLVLVFRHYGLSIGKLLVTFIGVHLFTFPVVQMYAGYTGLIIEIVPVVVETLAYRYFCGFGITKKKGWGLVIGANFISWLVGFIWFGYYINWEY